MRWIVVVVVVVLAGCGRGGSERAAATVTERFLSAVAAGEGERACALLSVATAESIAPCLEAVTDLEVGSGAVTRARVFGIGAQVEAGGATYFLELTRAGWRISAAGCAPRPDDRPYDCEAEA